MCVWVAGYKYFAPMEQRQYFAPTEQRQHAMSRGVTANQSQNGSPLQFRCKGRHRQQTLSMMMSPLSGGESFSNLAINAGNSTNKRKARR
jgi:hypothetical protein